MRWMGLAFLAAFAAWGCNGDPVMAGRRIIETDPVKAAALFREAASKKNPCFDCDVWLGAALERTKDWAGAAGAYERALAQPESRSRPEPVAARLLEVYETQFRDASDATFRTGVARKAAPLEAALDLSKPWANPYLYEIARKDIAALADAGKSREVQVAIEATMALYLSSEVKKQFATEATEALRKAFVIRMRGTFDKDLAPALERDGFYDPKTGEVVIANRFTIPPKKADPRFDPASPDFAAAVKKESCLPLRAMLGDLVQRCAPALGLRKATPADLDWVFAQLFKDSQAGFAAYGPAERSPSGEPWLCEVRLPLPKFLGELYRFAE